MKIRSLLIALFSVLVVATAQAAPRELDWIDLLPENERGSYDLAPPPPSHDYLSGESGGLAAQQRMNFNVNKALEGVEVKIPGFIVPLELDEKGLVTEFFLVPYFGACIHVPPPPANQMVFVVMNKGLSLDSMYAAYWITGKMGTKSKSTRLGAAAYTLTGTAVEEYKF
ncbi:MAG: DUF3299 domain-containing protein [Gammaproteobacteria bacterium]|nr:DUF3299 domain-containing protein [Gammaproteobacteria bacterium]